MSAPTALCLALVWREPLWFALLACPLLLMWLRRRHGRSALWFTPFPFVEGGRPDLNRTSAVFGDGPLPRSLRSRLAWLPSACLVLGLVSLTGALARPATREALPERHEGIDIVLCLDVSSSMQARDLDPRKSRLALAREAAAAFIRARSDDRIGLVAFARFPDLRCPPTSDHDALLAILADTQAVAPDGEEDKTGLGAAVARAAAVLAESRAPSRVVLLLTDGAETVAVSGASDEIAPIHGAQLAERFGVRVHAALIGSAAGVAAVDPAVLEAVTSRTGGLFQVARDATGLGSVYRAIDRLERSEVERARTLLVDRGLPLLLGALLLLSLWGIFAVAGYEGRP